MILNLIPPDAPNPNDYAGFLIWQVANKWEKYVNIQLKEYDTTQSECFCMISILQLLQAKNQTDGLKTAPKILPEITQVDIAKQSGNSIMNTSKILKNLEKKDLIERRTALDSRAKSVKLTKKGIQISMNVVSVLHQANSDFYGIHGNKNLIQSLQNINQNN